MLSKADLLKAVLTKTEIFKSSLGEIKLRQLSMSESEEIVKIQKDDTKTLHDVMIHTLKCSMVEPEFFTEEEIKQMGQKGYEFMFEVFNEVPLIGMSKKEREEHKKKIEEYLKKEHKELSEEEIEKK